MKPIFLFLFWFFPVVLYTSCTQRKEPIQPLKPHQQPMVKIIPVNDRGQPSYAYRMTQKRGKLIGLKPLDIGYDSLSIRLWYVFNHSGQIVELHKTGGLWNATCYSMKTGVVNDQLKDVDIKSFQAFPKSGWESFANKLLSSNILNLPDDSDVKDYDFDSATDASFIVVEIAKQNHYRIYSYTEPYRHLMFPEARTMENIMNFIDDELGIKRNEKL